MNIITDELKSKIINHKYIDNKELDIFINYVIYKSKVITNYMKDVLPYSRMSICNEIFWSYNIDSSLYKDSNNKYYCIFNINNKEYILDINYKYKEYYES